MSFLPYLFLGALQGLAEFLPISSSGHLVLAQKLIPGFHLPNIFFDVIVHMGTLFAVLYYFRKKILEILLRKWKYLLYIIIATIPAGVIGYFFQDLFESFFDNVKLVGIALLLTGLMNLMVDKFSKSKKSLNFKNTFLVGFAQALAITPGISRSGITIFSGVFQGIKKEKAAEFSFILSIPAVLGANLLQIMKNPHGLNNGNISYYLVGFLTAFVFGLFSIKLVFQFLKDVRFKVFAYYCFVVGILALIF